MSVGISSSFISGVSNPLSNARVYNAGLSVDPGERSARTPLTCPEELTSLKSAEPQ